MSCLVQTLKKQINELCVVFVAWSHQRIFSSKPMMFVCIYIQQSFHTDFESSNQNFKFWLFVCLNIMSHSLCSYLLLLRIEEFFLLICFFAVTAFISISGIFDIMRNNALDFFSVSITG